MSSKKQHSPQYEQPFGTQLAHEILFPIAYKKAS